MWWRDLRTESGKGLKTIRRLAVAISMYSRIPMPYFKWDEDDYKHILVFFPVVGIIIGGVIFALSKVYEALNPGEIFMIAGLILVPLLITGGFHVDGYMDVEDAFKSYKSPQEKLEILKDPHIGAFSVIRLVILGLIWVMALSLILNFGDKNALNIYSLIFFISRCATGVLSLVMKNPKKDGMLTMEAGGKSVWDVSVLSIMILIGTGCVFILDVITGALCTAVILLFTLYFYKKITREFGGITGDSAGFYTVVSELLMTVAIGVGCIF